MNKTSKHLKMNKTSKHLKIFENNSSYTKNIIRPLSALNYHLEKINNGKKKKVGLMLCHGHIHGYKILENFKFIDYWYFVDINPTVYPDYVCDITNRRALRYFPNNFFDYIISAYCPIGDLKKKYFQVMNNLKRTLKKNGTVISLELPTLFFHFFNEFQLGKVSFCLSKHTNAFVLETFKKDYNYDRIHGMKKNCKIFCVLRDFYLENHPSIIKIIELACIKLVLRKQEFDFIKMNERYLVFKP